MIIECSRCESKVDAKEIARREYGPTEDYDPFAVFFLECPVCGGVLIGQSDIVRVDHDVWDYEKPKRVWPSGQDAEHLDWSIPTLVRRSLEEALRCYNARAYAACAVMSGRAIEAVCSYHKTRAKNLAGGLKELKAKGVIDGRLYDWGEALRDQRNIGAHATEEDISREDAKDVYDFSVAICEYVFVLAGRYIDFTARLAKRKKTSRAPESKPKSITPLAAEGTSAAAETDL
jgi:hypothetical protein